MANYFANMFLSVQWKVLKKIGYFRTEIQTILASKITSFEIFTINVSVFGDFWLKIIIFGNEITICDFLNLIPTGNSHFHKKNSKKLCTEISATSIYPKLWKYHFFKI